MVDHPRAEQEGLSREVVRNIQELRKTAKFTPADKIVVYVATEGELKAAIEKNAKNIVRETKAVRLEFGKSAKTSAQIEVVVDKQPLWIGIKKC